jgi:hypothetical protein
MNQTETTPAMTVAPHLFGTRPIGEWFLALSADTQADITEMVNEQGYPLHDIHDFIVEHGEQAYVAGHYVTWCELTEQPGPDNEAIWAYIDEVGIDNIGSFEQAYMGEYGSEAEFAEQYFRDILGLTIPECVVVDWQATWDTELEGIYTYNDRYVFNTQA